MVSKKQYEALMKRLNVLEKSEAKPKGKAKATSKKGDFSSMSYQELQKESKKRGIKANQSKDALIEALNGSTEEWKTVKENVLKREGRPVAYALIQKKKGSKDRRAVIGGYCSIPASKVSDVKEYFIKHTHKDKKGKKVKGYYVPRKRGSIVLSKGEVSSLIKGF